MSNSTAPEHSVELEVKAARDNGVGEYGCPHYRRRAKLVTPCWWDGWSAGERITTRLENLLKQNALPLLGCMVLQASGPPSQHPAVVKFSGVVTATMRPNTTTRRYSCCWAWNEWVDTSPCRPPLVVRNTARRVLQVASLRRLSCATTTAAFDVPSHGGVTAHSTSLFHSASVSSTQSPTHPPPPAPHRT